MARLQVVPQGPASLSLFCILVAVSLAFVAAESNNLPSALAKKDSLTVCVDDSDCSKDGSNYRCFMYICYPWKDDSDLAPEVQKEFCRKNQDCLPNQECFRHHNIRQVTRGLCFDEVTRCEGEQDCSDGYECCGGYCCEGEYFQQFAGLPCISDLACQDMHLGKYCCPQANGNSSVCCDIDPNAPPPQAPSTKDNGAMATTTGSLSFFAMLMASVVAALRL